MKQNSILQFRQNEQRNIHEQHKYRFFLYEMFKILANLKYDCEISS